MSLFNHQHEHDLERHLIHLIEENNRLLGLILRHLNPTPTEVLSKIKIAFSKGPTMAAVIGPVTLSVGQSATASVVGFDQTGNPMPAGFVMPPVTFTVDNAAVASSTPNSDNATDVVAALSAGVANLTASVTSAEGLSLTDTEAVTVSPVVLPPPVLSSIKVAFDTTAAAVASVRAAARH